MSNAAEPLWVYYRNIATGAMLVGPKEITGTLGTAYQVLEKQFEHFQYVDASGRLTGFLGNHPQSVALYYRPDNWKDCQRVDLYLQTLTEVPVYQTPGSQKAPLRTLPAQTTWATRLRATVGQGDFWYQISENQWVYFDSDQVALLNNAHHVQNDTYASQFSKTQLKQTNAIVDFLPGQLLDAYDRPYGMPSKTVQNADYVVVDERLTDELDVSWSHIQNVGWINDIYLKHF